MLYYKYIQKLLLSQDSYLLPYHKPNTGRANIVSQRTYTIKSMALIQKKSLILALYMAQPPLPKKFLIWQLE